MDEKSKLPEEGEMVKCTVTSVQSHSVFALIDEYKITGMIHISEVAPGRIRNIRDYVVEGRSIICKVLRVNSERGHVDLSLRRVSESQRRNKINEIKKEKLAEKLVEVVAGNIGVESKVLYSQISTKVHEHFYLLFECFTEIVRGTFPISGLKLPKNVSDELKKVVLDRLKPEIIISRGKLKLTSYAPDGVEVVRVALKKAIHAGAETRYMGGGSYSLSCTASNHKAAESALNKAAGAALDFIKSKHGSGEFLDSKA